MATSFKIFYGTREKRVNVTDKITAFNGVKIIPEGDLERSIIFGIDPAPGVVKSVYILDKQTETEYPYNTLICITDSIIYRQDTIPKNISTSTLFDRLEQIQNSLTLRYGEFKDEYPEQIMSLIYLKGDEKVLEIGANIGRNSLIISRLLKDSSNLLSIESDSQSFEKLNDNKIINKLDFNIENCAISKRQLIQKDWNTVISNTVPDGWTRVKTLTYQQIVDKWKIQFDTLVIDCEGAFYYMLMDEPEIMKGINLVIMENDYQTFLHKEYIEKVFKANGFYLDYSRSGGWGPCISSFYEVWKK
jgi:FkbM family methyltransferase